MSGDGPHNMSIPNSMDPRCARQVDNSPLQIFVNAKKKINDIFWEIEEHVKDAVEYLHGKFNLTYHIVNIQSNNQ